MKTIAVGQFKAKCLRLIKEVGDNKEPLIITKHGKPLAQLVPVTQVVEDVRQKLLGSVILEKDIVSPLDEDWEVLK